MTQASIITNVRLRVLRTLRRRARSHAAQSAFAISQGMEDMRTLFEDRAARNDESICAARRAYGRVQRGMRPCRGYQPQSARTGLIASPNREMSISPLC